MTVSLKSGHFRVENRKAQSEIHGPNPIGLVPSGSALVLGPDQTRTEKILEILDLLGLGANQSKTRTNKNLKIADRAGPRQTFKKTIWTGRYLDMAVRGSLSPMFMIMNVKMDHLRI